MDPDFSYGVTQARTTGRLTLRLAQADMVPLDFGPLVAALETYVKEVRALADRKREETDQRRRDLDEGLYAAWFTPHETRVAPARQDPVPHLNFAPMDNGLDRVRKAVAAFDARPRGPGRQGLSTPTRARELDAILRGSERALTRTEGLPGRPWYRHQIYAPGPVHGLRREDAARGARGHRASEVARGRGAGRRRGAHPRRLRGAGRARDGGALRSALDRRSMGGLRAAPVWRIVPAKGGTP